MRDPPVASRTIKIYRLASTVLPRGESVLFAGLVSDCHLWGYDGNADNQGLPKATDGSVPGYRHTEVLRARNLWLYHHTSRSKHHEHVVCVSLWYPLLLAVPCAPLSFPPRREAETQFAMRHDNIVRLLAFNEGGPQRPPCM